MEVGNDFNVCGSLAAHPRARGRAFTRSTQNRAAVRRADKPSVRLTCGGGVGAVTGRALRAGWGWHSGGGQPGLRLYVRR